MHKCKWLLFLHLADDLLRVSVGGSNYFMSSSLMDQLFHVLTNMYYYFHSTANSESKDFFSVFLDHEFDVNLNKVDRWLIIKPTEAHSHSLMFSLQSNSPIHKRPTDHLFCDQMFEFQHLRRSDGLKRSECETFLGHYDVLCGWDILFSLYLSPLIE